MTFRTFNTLVAALLLSACSTGKDVSSPLGQVSISPPFADAFSCSQHWEGQLPYKGDALGSDCYITGLVETPDGGGFYSAHTGDGLSNEDWFSWQQPVLAGFDGTVVRLSLNEVTNSPGHLGEPPASMIVLEREDGVHLLYAHIADPRVAEGDAVTAGQQIAIVGNNGFARNPHIHLGAWKDKTPLAIVIDLGAYGEVMGGDQSD